MAVCARELVKQKGRERLSSLPEKQNEAQQSHLVSSPQGFFATADNPAAPLLMQIERHKTYLSEKNRNYPKHTTTEGLICKKYRHQLAGELLAITPLVPIPWISRDQKKQQAINRLFCASAPDSQVFTEPCEIKKTVKIPNISSIQHRKTCASSRLGTKFGFQIELKHKGYNQRV